MRIHLLIKTESLVCLACDTAEGWKETFEVFKSEGIKIDSKSFSDFPGNTAIPSDQLLFYHNHPSECPSLINRNWF